MTLSFLLEEFPFLFKGLFVTFGLVVLSLGLGFLLGLPLAIGSVYGSRLAVRLISFYIWLFRGLPVLVLFFLFYLGLFPLMGLDLSPFSAAVLVLGLRSGAYQSQIFRGSIQSVAAGQMLAARSLGLSQARAVWFIVLPQALRIAIPAWSSEYAGLLHDSAIAYALGVAELLTRANFISSRTFKPLQVYLLCAVLFILLTYLGTKALQLAERKTRIPGFEQEALGAVMRKE